MKKIILFLAVLISLTSCKKEKIPANVVEALPTGTTIVAGTFTGNAHTTTGMVKIIKDAAGKTFLVLENVQTSSGPDVHIWLAPDITGATYVEIGLLKATSGNFYYEIPSTVNYTTNNKVLIWCIKFASLFGNAVLK